MKKLLVLLVLLAVAAGIVVAVYPKSPTPPGSRPPVTVGPAHGRQKAPWDPYGYQCREAPRRRRYNLPVIIGVNGHSDPNVRLLLDLQDPANYYFVELTQDATRIGKVESGLEATIGTQTTRGLLLDAENKAVVKRRHDSIAVVLNDQVVARAEGEAFHGGQVGAGVLDGSATVRFGTPQPCDPIYLGDDFMKAAGEGQMWATVSGSWKIAELRNPSLSSNAFYYIGQRFGSDPPAASVRGQWFWDDYRLRVACASFGREDVGIFFYYRDADNCYLFRWNAEKQAGDGRGRRQLVKRWHGQETVLAEVPGGYERGVWYELVAEVVGGRIRTLIDGHEVFNVTDDDVCFGQIGLYSATASPATAHFDDMLVQTVRRFEDDFSTVAARRWRPLKGSWEQRAEGGGYFCFVDADEPAKAVAGSSRWRDYTASVTLRLPDPLTPESQVGLVAHYLDEMNYALFAWKPGSGTARLEVRVEGERVAIEEVQAPQAPATTSHILDLACEHGVLTARLNGQPLTSAWVPRLRKGRAGLYAAGVEGLAFDRVQVRFPLPPEPVLTANEVFEKEHTMQIWAGAAQDWEATSETIAGNPIRPQWHRADFFGPATIEAEIRKELAPSGEARRCRLVLSAESPRTVASGYNFVLTWPSAAGQPCQAVLLRGAETVGQASVTPEGRARRLRLQRIDHHVIASVNEDQVLAFRDAEPLAGSRAAYATTGLAIPATDVQVFSDNVKVYSFSRAISDWRTAAGTWEVTNRWECDPRWSFFSGVPQDGRLAALWNKHAFEGDVTVEFAVGPKMENARGGGNYRYARDFNVTIGADGQDIRSGYSFTFGARDNSLTGIWRGDKLLARSSFVIPRSSGIHRRWFYIKVEKRGNTLNYWIDGSRVLTAQDPDPLTGNRVAIWSWNCGIMIARVRISAEHFGEMELPASSRGPCRTIYDSN